MNWLVGYEQQKIELELFHITMLKLEKFELMKLELELLSSRLMKLVSRLNSFSPLYTHIKGQL